MPSFEIKDVDLAGRIGRLRIGDREIETPAFFPVIDVERQETSIRDIVEAGFKQVITNAYLLYKRYKGGLPGGNIHSFLGFEGVVMTDSGAYQILEYGSISVSQETIIEYQKTVGSDIAVILDIPTGDVDRDRALKTVMETLKRASEAQSLIDPERRVWVLPIQGGRHLDLVEYSARKALEMEGYMMYGIGSPTVYLEQYKYDVIADMIYTAKRVIPGGRPVHLFGAGSPLIIPFAIALGIDSFDSASYILYARDERYMTERGVYRLRELKELPCNCPVCSKREPGDLLELDEKERTRLIALHNLYVINKSIRETKQAIREGRLWEYLEEVARRHPSTSLLLRRFRFYYKLIEKGVPTSLGTVKGLKLMGEESLWNPKIVGLQRRVMGFLRSIKEVTGASEAVYEPWLGKDCPAIDDDAIIILYKPYIGVVPLELCGVYPTIQSDYGRVTGLSIDLLYYQLLASFRILRDQGVKVAVRACRGVEWSYIIGSRLDGLGIVEWVESC